MFSPKPHATRRRYVAEVSTFISARGGLATFQHWQRRRHTYAGVLSRFMSLHAQRVYLRTGRAIACGRSVSLRCGVDTFFLMTPISSISTASILRTGNFTLASPNSLVRITGPPLRPGGLSILKIRSSSALAYVPVYGNHTRSGRNSLSPSFLTVHRRSSAGRRVRTDVTMSPLLQTLFDFANPRT